MDSDVRHSLKLLEEGQAQMLREIERIHARLALLEPKRFVCTHCGRERVNSGRIGEKCFWCGK